MVGVVGLTSIAVGQSLLTEDDVPMAVGRFVNGPMTWTPTLTLRDAGVDTNIFTVPTNEKRDTTASVMPSVDSRLALGALRAHSKGHLEYLYFERYAQERAVNGQVETRLEMPDRRVRPLVRLEWAKVRDRSTSEVEIRVPRREHELAGALETRVAPRTWVGGAVARRTIAYEPGYTFGEADLSRQLNRTEDSVMGAMRTALSPFTTLKAEVSTGWDMFTLQPERDTRNVRATVGFQFAPDAVISGHALVGYHAMEAKWKDYPGGAGSFSGLMASVDLTFVVVDRTQVVLRAGRDTTYSASTRQPFYLSTVGEIELTHALVGPLELLARGRHETLGYAATAVANGRTDQVGFVGGGLAVRMSSNARVGFNVDQTIRWSTEGAAFGYTRRRFYTTATYGF
jgi:hypothetical protein